MGLFGKTGHKDPKDLVKDALFVIFSVHMVPIKITCRQKIYTVFRHKMLFEYKTAGINSKSLVA